MPWSWVDTEYSIHQVQHTLSTAYTKYSIHRVQHTPSTAYTEYSIHRVQHTPSAAYTKYSIYLVQHTASTAYSEYSIHHVQYTPSTASIQDCLSSLHSHDYKLTRECSFSFRRASLHNRPPSASLPWELKCEVTLSHSDVCKSTNWWMESQHPAHHPATGSKCSSNLTRSRPPKCITKLTWSRPPSVSPNSLNYCLQVRTIMASKCISKLAWSQPPCVFQTRSITVSKFAQSWPPRASLNSLHYGLQVRTIMASKHSYKLDQSWSWRASLHSLYQGLHMSVRIWSITASKCISKLAQSQPRSVSLSVLDHHVQARLELLSSTACSQSSFAVCIWGAI